MWPFSNSNNSIPLKIPEDVNEIFNLALNNNISSLVAKLKYFNIEPNDNLLLDSYSNTLLHIAVFTNNYGMTKELLKKKCDMKKKNLFGYSPLDICLENHNKNLLELFFNYDTMDLQSQIANLKSEIDNLKSENELIKNVNDVLEASNRNLLKESEEFKQKNINEINSKKRKKENDDLLLTENKRLKMENNELIKENGKLRKQFDYWD